MLPSKISARDAAGILPDLLRRADGDNAAARITSAGAHVDDIIGTADHIEIVLNDDDGRAAIEQRLEHAQQHPHIQRVQADARLVEHEHGIRLDAPDLAGQLQPLRLAAGEARRFLAEREVTEAELLDRKSVV